MINEPMLRNLTHEEYVREIPYGNTRISQMFHNESRRRIEELLAEVRELKDMVPSCGLCGGRCVGDE